MSSEDGTPEPVFIFPDGTTGTAADVQNHIAQQNMANNDFHTSVRRLLLLELSEEGLATLQKVFRMLGQTDQIVEMVNYFEGTIDLAVYARENASQVQQTVDPLLRGAPAAPAAPVTAAKDPDAVPEIEDFLKAGTFGCHQFMPGGLDNTECTFSARVEGAEEALDCGLPPQAKPHTRWTEQNPTTP